SSSITGALALNASLNITQSFELELDGGATSFSPAANTVTTVGGFGVHLSSGNITVGSVTGSNTAINSFVTNGPSSVISLNNGIPVGHQITLDAGTGTISGLTSPTQVFSPLVDGSNNGGSVFLGASNLVSSNINYVINVNGAGTGN